MANDYHQFIADLTAKRAALQSEFQSKIAAIDAALDGARILLDNNSNEITMVTPSVLSQQFLAPFTNMSIPTAAETAIREAGRQLNTRELCDRLVKGGFQSRSANLTTTIGSVLSRHSKEVGRVVRMPNGWGLGEWEHQESQRSVA